MCDVFDVSKITLRQKIETVQLSAFNVERLKLPIYKIAFQLMEHSNAEIKLNTCSVLKPKLSLQQKKSWVQLARKQKLSGVFRCIWLIKLRNSNITISGSCPRRVINTYPWGEGGRASLFSSSSSVAEVCFKSFDQQ